MNVRLPTPLEDFVRSKVAAGKFQSVDDVICEGLRLLQKQEEWKAEARTKIDIGWEQAKAGELLDPEQVRNELVQRKKRWKNGKVG
jgi:putative addiction module CopG family antidote